jgi:hypothetical protein
MVAQVDLLVVEAAAVLGLLVCKEDQKIQATVVLDFHLQLLDLLCFIAVVAVVDAMVHIPLALEEMVVAVVAQTPALQALLEPLIAAVVAVVVEEMLVLELLVMVVMVDLVL